MRTNFSRRNLTEQVCGSALLPSPTRLKLPSICGGAKSSKFLDESPRLRHKSLENYSCTLRLGHWLRQAPMSPYLHPTPTLTPDRFSCAVLIKRTSKNKYTMGVPDKIWVAIASWSVPSPSRGHASIAHALPACGPMLHCYSKPRSRHYQPNYPSGACGKAVLECVAHSIYIYIYIYMLELFWLHVGVISLALIFGASILHGFVIELARILMYCLRCLCWISWSCIQLAKP